MVKKQDASVSSEEVLQVESKWPFLPIYPTHDQYVQQSMAMPQSEGLHVLTRSVMKELRDHSKWFVLHDNHKKRVLFTVREDVWRRSDNLPESESVVSVEVRVCKYNLTICLCVLTLIHLVTFIPALMQLDMCDSKQSMSCGMLNFLLVSSTITTPSPLG